MGEKDMLGVLESFFFLLYLQKVDGRKALVKEKSSW